MYEQSELVEFDQRLLQFVRGEVQPPIAIPPGQPGSPENPIVIPGTPTHPIAEPKPPSGAHPDNALPTPPGSRPDNELPPAAGTKPTPVPPATPKT